MRIPFSWHLEHERKIPPKGQRHSAPLCVVRASEFRTPSKALFCATRGPIFCMVGDPAIIANWHAGWPSAW